MERVVLPQLTLSMEFGTLVRWLVADGDVVATGDVIAEVETDKAIAELESPGAGTITVVVTEGSEIPVGTELARLESSSDTAAEVGVRSSEPASNDKPADIPASGRAAGERVVDGGSAGGAGRFTAPDVEAAGDRHPGSALRRAVVANLAASWRELPHIQISAELDASGLVAARLSGDRAVTYTDLLISTLAAALLDVPDLNAVAGQISSRINVAVAMATQDGVVSPVVRDVAELTVPEVSVERRRLTEGARSGATEPRDLAGGTITLTNLGTHLVDFFHPVISGPQVATVATGRIIERPTVVGGTLVVRPSCWVTVAIDHRHADGEAGGRLLTALQRSFDELTI